MKKYLLILALTGVFLANAYSSDFPPAVPKPNNELQNVDSLVNPISKKAFGGKTFNKIKSKAIRNFKKEVKFANNERWVESTGGFVVTYEDKNGIRCRVDYDKNASGIASTRYYGESELPKEIRRQVKLEYLDFIINSVQEITFADRKVYFIQIHDDNKWVHLRICDGEMDVYKEFTKSK